MELRFGMCVLLLSATGIVNGDLYTALIDLEALVETEAVLLSELDNYIGATERRLSQLRRLAAEYSREHSEAIADVSAYLHNPINAYRLIKRLTIDWKHVESLMDDFGEKEWLERRGRLMLPSEEDLVGAVSGLLRLQDTYQLDTASLARGQLNGVQYTTHLTADDCFQIGRISCVNLDHYHTVLWMSEALKLYHHEDNVKRYHQEDNIKRYHHEDNIKLYHHEDNVRRREILECLTYSTYKQGNVRSALQLNDELLSIAPKHLFALSNRTIYLADIEKGTEQVAENLLDEYTELYYQLCRDALSPSPQVLSQLKCQYVHRNQPFLRIAPLKEEEAYLDPRIVLYRDVIYDGEIDVIKKLALPRLQRATVRASKRAVVIPVSHRISKSAVLLFAEHPSIERLNRRIEMMTSLTMAYSPLLHVVNYGIGGYYKPHWDFAQGPHRNIVIYGDNIRDGNRVATVLSYMSDVAQGGATVFPYLNVTVQPKKGTALVWYNMHLSGEGDLATMHAACPVLVGCKWVTNKWVNERGQEFRRPCALHRQTRYSTNWYS
ncbi:prolyl 4-hydroxylase subunit alpha-2-like [Nilaparvata lugens]|uniref:prolyl 4-hydroxylase subunit alpha-2-like n=1 Tax=Nilaparvata lugens TaxID=108931 RepID=UPI00193EBB18|nr:prolyl 4-hydroxylase subunit alpha-2-like [Nilaparvata lugens]